MKVVTLMNYNWADARCRALAAMFVDLIHVNQPDAALLILAAEVLPETVTRRFTHTSIEYATAERDVAYGTSRNLSVKLFNLCRLEEPFLYLDADCAVLGSLEQLWALRTRKPLVMVNQRPRPEWVPGRFPPYPNGGVMLCGDPSFLDYPAIMRLAASRRFKFDVPGYDQAALYHSFRETGYDWSHPEAAERWNCCAGDCTVAKAGGRWTAHDSSRGEVIVRHYWGRFKPWQVSCPIYQEYRQADVR